MGGLDRVKIKHLLKIFWPPQYKRAPLFMIFARERAQSVCRILPPPKCAKHEEAEAYSRITTKRAT